jgi:hypothetical protein
MEPQNYGLACLVALAVVTFLMAEFFSTEARERRRRSKNYGRVITRARRPMVRLSARTK